MERGFRGHEGTKSVGVQSGAEGDVEEGPPDVQSIPGQPYRGSASPGHRLYFLGATEHGTGQGGPGGPRWGPPARREWQGPVGTHPSRASKQGCKRRRGRNCEKGGRGGLHLYLSRVCVQGVPGQTLCPKDTPELSLQPPKEALPLWAQQEAGAARELQTQHVTADAA